MDQRLIWLQGFTRFVLRHYRADQCGSIAAQLTVTSLLALVPLLTVVFSVLTLFPQFAVMESQIQGWIFENFIPDSSQVIQQSLNQYIENTKQLTFLGMLLLLVTSLMLMRTIDNSLNHIWHANKRHSPVRVLLVYWAVLTMGPMLLALSLAVSSYFASMPWLTDVAIQEHWLIKRGLPFVMTFVAFVIIFMAVPNHRVKLVHASLAALFTALVFEIAKWGFAVFVHYVSTYQLIFGALATVPLFLIWVYLCWAILLLGAQVCRGLAIYQPSEARQETSEFIVAAQVMMALAKAQAQRLMLSEDQLLQRLPMVSRDQVSEVVSQLERAGVVCTSQQGEYGLIGDSTSYCLADLLSAGFAELPSRMALKALSAIDSPLAERIDQGFNELKRALSDPLVGEPNQN